VSLSIQYASLDDPPEYYALSYVWGDMNHTEQILVDGAPIHVTKNLVAAVRVLQRSNLKTAALWIDAICINQNDMTERAAQVRLMGRIYKNSEGVVAWL
ncbi:heterokaryon incompatibility, partial [Sporormia fimetaria CBS 119925]